MSIFDRCHDVNNLLLTGDESGARAELIKLLDKLQEDGLGYSPLVNHLIRSVGLYPYLELESAAWDDRYVHEVFKANIGGDEPVTLHREQSKLLNALLEGRDVAVSAPTSFGKSFVIDAFIAIQRPETVVIIVPTIALADETRRRIHAKFGRSYKIITTPHQKLADKNILIFPQERAIHYLDQLQSVDILIVDEFYKASTYFDKERAPTLIRAIMQLNKVARQRYFLAPHISELQENPFTEGMEFLRLDFHTVFLEKNDIYEEIGRDEKKKSQVLVNILLANQGKTLIYAGTYTNIKKISYLLIDTFEDLDRPALHQFGDWLSENYDPNWDLSKLVRKGIGIHNGQLHRSISQIQIRLFDDENGLNVIVSTSSIIEGVNTSAENVILWSNRNGQVRIDDFTYRNIMGRGGRMLRHFVGKIFVLEEPPDEVSNQLELGMPEQLLGTIGSSDIEFPYTDEETKKIGQYKAEMSALVGADNLEFFQNNNALNSSDASTILDIARSIKREPVTWNGLQYLNSNDPSDWDRLLYELIKLQPGAWNVRWSTYVAFVKTLSRNWERALPELLFDLSFYDLGIDDFFKLERNTTYRLSALLSDVQTIYNKINADDPIDVSLAISRFSHAFLPSVVYQLEEYGLPRMVSRKIHRSGLIDLEATNKEVDDVIDDFQEIGMERLSNCIEDLRDFDRYILKYFYDGIS